MKIAFRGVSKRFPGVLALDDVSFEIASGSCHALCGENGAGKSTLGKILAGIYQPDTGGIHLDDRPVRLTAPTDALAAGIALVHQELSFCDNLTVAENVCLGALPSRAGIISRSGIRRKALSVLASIAADIDVDRPMGMLAVGQQQMVQIAGALDRGARVVIFDEPTSSLSQHEAERLYELIGRLRQSGVTCIYISHRLEEIFRLCDAVTVLRDGGHVSTTPTREVDRARLIELMIGRRLEDYFPRHVESAPGTEMLRVDNLTSPAGFAGMTFSVRAGEVVGMAGLVGAGRSEVAQATFGLDRHATGRVWIAGRSVTRRDAAHSISLGLGLAPEDRKRQGLVLSMSALENGTLAILSRLARLGFVTRDSERRAARPFFDRLGVPIPRIDVPIATFSGGNQQKVVLTKWLAARCPVLILDEPTRGVDVGAKAEIHALIDELAASGTAILLISSEMPEILNLSTRILVVRGGRIVAELPRADARQETLMRLMAGVGGD
jgi:ABC-type sugar transport system ATPase subunit